MLSTRMNRWTFAAITLAALAAPAAVLAQTPEHTGDNAAQFPSKADLKSLTTSGSYLAARHASVERDAASAAAFYRSALRTDPKNNELWTAPSSPRWPMATSTRPSSSPIAS